MIGFNNSEWKTCEECGKSSFYKNGTCRSCQQKFPKWCNGLQIEEFKNKFPDLYQSRVKQSLQKRKSTNIEKYGVEFISQTQEVKHLIKQAWSNKSEEEIKLISNKVKQTCLEKYNVLNPFQIPEIKEKAIKSIKQKSKKIKIKNKKSRDFIQYKNKVKQTCLEKYNVLNPFQIPEIKEKAIKSIKQKYSYIDYNFLESLPEIFNGVTTEDITKIVELSKASRPTVLRYLKKQNIKIDYSYRQSYEDDLYEFILSLYMGKIVQNCKIHDIFIDIYLPEKKLAIEFNGDYWHSIECKHRNIDKNYHVNKTNKAESNGIRLIHVWESEWNNNQQKIKNIIKQYLNNKLPNLMDYQELPRDYFQVLDFPGCQVEEPILEQSGNFKVYKTGFIKGF